jgi:hypothetical protein
MLNGVRRVLRRSGLAILLVIFSAGALAFPGKHFDLQNLVEDSDVIAVVDISRIFHVGPTTVNVDDRSLSADAYEADVNTRRCIKGICPDRRRGADRVYGVGALDSQGLWVVGTGRLRAVVEGGEDSFE